MRDHILQEIKEERERQISEENYLPENDDFWSNGELADAAATYALTTATRKSLTEKEVPKTWPFGKEWYKPRNDYRRRELILAASLILAEIERIDRLR